MPHDLDAPLVHEYQGRKLLVKFEWEHPNDDIPMLARVVTEGEVRGMGELVVELKGPWRDYHHAMTEATRAAELWVDGELL